MIQRITVPIKLEYTDESPIIREQTVLAWVCGGYALHRPILADYNTLERFTKEGWVVTHVKTGKSVTPVYGFSREKAKRVFADFQTLELDGVRFADMDYQEARAAVKKLGPRIGDILRSRAIVIGGHRQPIA